MASSRMITDRRWTGGKVLTKVSQALVQFFLVCFALDNSTKLKLHIYFVNKTNYTSLEGKGPRYMKSI